MNWFALSTSKTGLIALPAGLLCRILFLLLIASGTRAQTPLVSHGETWRYRKGTSAPQTDWKTTAAANLDATWLSGQGGFGYAGNSFETSLCQTILSDMRDRYSTVAMRNSFEVISPVDPNLHLMLTVDWDDGFIAWLDGVYLVSANSPGSPTEPGFNASATASHESSRGDQSPETAVTYDLGPVAGRLAPGRHLLAMVGLNSSLSGSSDFIQIADLFLAEPPPSNCVSGSLNLDTTWKTAASPIAVCGDLTVSSGVTLKIEPGVTVQFAQGASLMIADGGRLLAEGNPTNQIHFTREPSATAWGGLKISGSVGSPETRIAQATFEFNGTTAIHSIGGTVFLDHLTFGSPEHQYVSLDDSSFLVSNCVFPTALLKFELVHGTGGIKSGGRGIFLRNFFGETIGYNDVVDFTGGNRPGPIVHFINNVFIGSQDDGIDLDGTDGWIEGNIFLHVHRNGDTPDSSSAISGGDFDSDTSELTIIGNLFFDCDNAVTAKQGNFFTLINNTIVHITKTGGIDGGSGVINVRDTTPSLTTFARGSYLEGNIIWDAEELIRNDDPAQTIVTLNNDLLPLPWNGRGSANIVANPLLKHIPSVSEARFTTWDEAQIMREWFSLQTNSPALSTGPNGRDKGGVIPLGASISGEPGSGSTPANITLVVGVNRTGDGMPAFGWPEGAGYTHYKWRLDAGAWSGEIPIKTPISISGLGNGAHYVEVSGKRDSGLYQDDPLFGLDAVVTRSRTWRVGSLAPPHFEAISRTDNRTSISFTVEGGQTYSLLYRELLDPSHPWIKLEDISAESTTGSMTLIDTNSNSTGFYFLVTPASP